MYFKLCCVLGFKQVSKDLEQPPRTSRRPHTPGDLRMECCAFCPGLSRESRMLRSRKLALKLRSKSGPQVGGQAGGRRERRPRTQARGGRERRRRAEGWRSNAAADSRACSQRRGRQGREGGRAGDVENKRKAERAGDAEDKRSRTVERTCSRCCCASTPRSRRCCQHRCDDQYLTVAANSSKRRICWLYPSCTHLRHLRATQATTIFAVPESGWTVTTMSLCQTQWTFSVKTSNFSD